MFRGDLFNCFSRSTGLVRAGRVTWPQYLRSLLATRAYATFDWGDPGPAVANFIALLRTPVRRPTPQA